MGNIVNAQSYLGKEVIALKDGSFLGKVQSIAINPSNKQITGINIRLKGLLSGRMFIPFIGIQGFGAHSVTIKESFEVQGDQKIIDEKEIMDMPVVTIGGTMLGKVSDFSFDTTTGEITQFMLTEGFVRDTLKGKGVLQGTEVSRIGKDVIIVSREIEDLDLESYDFDDESEETIEEEAIMVDYPDVGFRGEELVEEGEAEKSWRQALAEAKDLTESWKASLKEQGARLGEEAKELKSTGQHKLEDFFSEAQRQIQTQLEKLNQVKDIWQEKLTTIKAKPQEELGEQVIGELKGKTISKPLADDEGNVFILPGQILNDALIKRAIDKGKLHDLFILTATKDVEDQLEQIDGREKTE